MMKSLSDYESGWFVWKIKQIQKGNINNTDNIKDKEIASNCGTETKKISCLVLLLPRKALNEF